MAQNEATGYADGREIVISREFNFPRELVFEAWTDVKHLEKWWGPNDFTITTDAFEFKEGGVWQFTMKGPYGVFPNTVVFDEIKPPEKIVYTNSEAFTSVVTFTENNGKTTLTTRALFSSAEEVQMLIEKYGVLEGGKQGMEKLNAYLVGK